MKRMLLIVSVLCAMTATAGNKTNAIKRCAGLIAAKTHRFNARRSAQNDHAIVIKAFETVQEASEYGIARKAITDKYAQQIKLILQTIKTEEETLYDTHFKAHNEASTATLSEKLRVIAEKYATEKAELKAKYPKVVKVVPFDASLATDLDEVAAAVPTAV